jgi:hypothetical protein
VYNLTRHTRRFFTDEPDEMSEYDSILSNPLCSIINSWREKVIDSEYDEGRLVKTVTRLVVVISWEEKALL